MLILNQISLSIFVLLFISGIASNCPYPCPLSGGCVCSGTVTPVMNPIDHRLYNRCIKCNSDFKLPLCMKPTFGSIDRNGRCPSGLTNSDCSTSTDGLGTPTLHNQSIITKSPALLNSDDVIWKGCSNGMGGFLCNMCNPSTYKHTTSMCMHNLVPRGTTATYNALLSANSTPKALQLGIKPSSLRIGYFSLNSNYMLITNRPANYLYFMLLSVNLNKSAVKSRFRCIAKECLPSINVSTGYKAAYRGTFMSMYNFLWYATVIILLLLGGLAYRMLSKHRYRLLFSVLVAFLLIEPVLQVGLIYFEASPDKVYEEYLYRCGLSSCECMGNSTTCLSPKTQQFIDTLSGVTTFSIDVAHAQCKLTMGSTVIVNSTPCMTSYRVSNAAKPTFKEMINKEWAFISFACIIGLTLLLLIIVTGVVSQYQKRRQCRDFESLLNRLGSKCTDSTTGTTFTYSNISLKSNKKYILKSMDITLHSGQVTALMGSSGAGKSTLLKVIAQQPVPGYQTGSVAFNNQAITALNRAHYASLIGYVPQDDCHIPSLTVRQTLHYAARLKLPAPLSGAVVSEVVDAVVAALNLAHCQHTLVGDWTRKGISGGEKRRVSLAVELVARHRLLVLDEPASGLDDINALEVVKAIVRAARMPMKTPSHSFVWSKYQPAIVFFNTPAN